METHVSRSLIARRMLATLTVLLLGVLSLLVGAPAAQAEPDPGIDLGDPADLSTEVRISGLGAGAALSGFDAPPTFDPLTGYPAAVPPGSTAHSVSFAGLIEIEDPVSGRTGLAYCIDLFTDTGTGVHYQIGDWTEANVPNLGYVGYILANYFPLTDEPSAAPNDAQRAAAVQASIWFFSDNYVLPPTSPVYGLVAGIVADALLNGPAVEPTPPQLEVRPIFLPAPNTGEIVGPFEVTGDGPATIRSVGVEVFTDPEGTDLLADGAEVQPGTSLWARSVSSDLPQGFVLEREVDVLQSSVFLYDGSNPGRDDAQKLVLAQPTELIKRAGALLAPFQAGSLLVTKTIDGSGAGLQDDVEITVTCTDPDGDNDQEFVVAIPAGTAAGDHPEEIGGILAGSECAITETADGDNDLVNLVSNDIDPDTVTIPDGETAEVSVTNLYERALGGLSVTKTIGGDAAGLQDGVEITITCVDPVGEPDQDFVVTIPAGTAAGDYTEEFGDIPSGSECAITETADGDNDLVSLVSSDVSPATVTIADGETAQVSVTDVYERAVGTLAVTKTIDGAGAGLQNEVVIALDCDLDAFDQEFVIAAQAEAGTYAQPAVNDIPSGTTCTVTETSDGENGVVELTEVVIDPATFTIGDGTTTEVMVTDTYEPRDTDDGNGPGDGDSRATGSDDGPLASTGSSGSMKVALAAFVLLLTGGLLLIARSRAAAL